MIETNLYRDHFQNYKRYNVPKCQLLIADIPCNLGNNAYASNYAFGAAFGSLLGLIISKLIL